ncbi:cell surface protein SprA [Fluviicola sp.]|uniref:T9SS outer membrane translocon Sov/SprA n=1 Tax=Fluviicola sp. TaxID=1917219 RepID=UPI002823F88E|nr:cell surface protein SprA [Fluviicola sp.]MDR0802107.1 cell surface protein SprA [Fluviicola sp.]
MIQLLTAVVFCFVSFLLQAQKPDTTNQLPFPITNPLDPTQNNPQTFDLGDPSGVKKNIVFDPVTGKYIFSETMGNSNLNYRNPSMMTLEEYLEYERQKALKENWKDKIDAQTQEARALEFPIKIPSKVFTSFFGSDEITIRPQGSIELAFGVNSSRYDNPILPVKQRKITRFDFQQQIQMNLVGQIGTKLKLSASYNTQAAFDFDNVTKLGYSGDEDQIIQRLELGNVSFPSFGSLIPGSQTLFGAYAKLRFGDLTVDAIGASSKGKRTEINITGKAQIQPFEVTADNYEANRHYFLNLFFHDQYNSSMAQLPNVGAETYITRMEVWVTNRINNTENSRNILAFSDLGEGTNSNIQGGVLPVNPANPYPDNNANNLYNYLSNDPNIRGFNGAVSELSSQVVAPGPFLQAIHYEKVENARKLSESEYTYNALLGFISLSQPLNNDEVLAVAYEYTYRGQTFQVGEFSTDGIAGQNALILKLLKPTITNPTLKLWDLMMKNVYSIGAFQVDQTGFKLNIYYNNPETSVLAPIFPYPGLDDKQIITLVEMDRMNVNNQQFSDGLFDFVPIVYNGQKAETGGTINTRNGRVMFTTTEPFGQVLKTKLIQNGMSDVIASTIAYNELYDSTKTAAQQIPSKNRFTFKGEYQSSVTSDISLNALNVPEGAVKVTAGGIQLTEGTDYTVDYNLGRVKILNTGILESNTPIKISVESNSVFGFQSKSMVGTHLNYRFNKDFNIGATWLRMMERPVTQKVDMGSEPYKNNVIGFNINYRTELPFLTKLIDLLPIISTKEKSFMTFKGEFAHLIPGTPKAISKAGISYVDDFEGSQSTIDLRTQSAWRIASTPQGQSDLFPEGSLKTLANGFNRSLIAWYLIDPLFYASNNLTPQHIKDDPSQLFDSRMRQVKQDEIFPNQQLTYGSIPTIQILELGYYPKERGMYNYDTSSVDQDGTFSNPKDRWGGIMRSLTTNDFEQANVEYIQFWILDPFNQDAMTATPNLSGGDLYFNLGNVSEDILTDSRKSFENGIPPYAGANYPVVITPWAKVSTQQVVVNAFDNDPNSRANQDVGLDGYRSDEEQTSYTSYVNWVQSNGSLTPDAKAKMIADPSTDDYNFYRDDHYDEQKLNILQRYKRYNGMEGNSPTTAMSAAMNPNGGGYPTQARNTPDLEDINQDNNLSESEAYFQYKVSLRPSDMVVGKNYITSMVTYQPSNSNKIEKWYQFKIPVKEPERSINGIRDFRSIRFMRMFLKGFDEEVIVRFAKLELVRGEWRKYLLDLTTPGEVIQVDPNLTVFNIGALNFEENNEKQPIGYQIPPGIQREIDPSQPQQRQMNEQALTLDVCNLQDGDARAAYKNVQFDVRTYKKLKMFVHAEEVTANSLHDKDLTLFVRLGTDFVDNYYEYELPLYLTAWGTNNADYVWPESNNMEIVFDDLLNLKKRRNDLLGSPGSGVAANVEYVILDPENPDRRIKVKGSPNLQGIKTIMIGVRNPRKNDPKPWPDDGLAKCVQVWVNELRLSDFVDDGGSAAIAQMQVQAADFGSFSLSGNYSGVNWGAVDSRVQERQRNQKLGMDFQTNLQLGQFFGNRIKLSVPFFYGYSVGVINPEYDPFNPDIKLSSYEAGQRREIAKVAQDYTERKSYNFQGVRKERGAGKKAHFYDISNWTLGYGYSENFHRDFNTNYDRTKQWKGSLVYGYSFDNKPWEPFKKTKFMQKSKWWGLLKETSIGYLPKTLGFTNDIQRNYNERQIRNTIDTSASAFQFKPVYVKNFQWSRGYRLGWDLTKNLKLTFNATNRAIFDEGDGEVNRKGNQQLYREFKDTVWKQMGTFGKTMDYSHDYNFSYNVPFNLIPALDWLNGNAKYAGAYNWQRAPLGQESYGNIVQNSRTINAQLQANMTTLYNKIPFFKKVNTSGGAPGGRMPVRQRAGGTDEDSKSKETTGKETAAPAELKPPKPLEEMTKKERRQWERKKRKWEKKQKKEQKKKDNKDKKVNPVLGFGARLLMSVRNVSGTYNQTDGTLLPGYNQESRILGFNPAFDKGLGGFIFGQQSYSVAGRETGYNIAQTVANNGWLVDNPALNRQHSITHSQTFTGRATLEPIKDLTIDLSLNRNMTENTNDFFRYNDLSQQFESQSRFRTATLTYSTISIGSAFEKLSAGYESGNFKQMRETTKTVSGLLGSSNANSSGSSGDYRDGYGISQQEVVIGAFLSSYTNGKLNNRSVNPFAAMPLPNWTVNYNGLAKFEKMKKYVKNFVIRHGYSSTVTLGQVQSNLNATFDQNGSATARDLNGNFISERNIQTITISERFSPLIGFDATWNIKKQGLITKFEIKKDRSSTLSLSNNQVTEVLGNEIVVGAGYKFPKVRLPFKIGKNKPENPLNIRFDFTFRDNLTVIRKVVESTEQATAGQRVISIKSSIDYNIGANLMVAFYYDQVITNPKIATSYPTGNMSTGIRFRYNLGGL